MAVPRPADAWLGADRSATFRAHVERIRRVQVISDASLARLAASNRGRYEALARAPL
jgi:hypothetical protein